MIWRPALALLALLSWLSAAGAAGAGGCRLALVLALDVSSSVDAQEYRQQRDGLAAALDSQDVRFAILNGGEGDVMLSAYEWSGRYKQQTILDWARLDSPAAIDAAVVAIASARRSETEFPTAMGYALGFGADMLAKGPACARRVIDMSGDGITNEGFGPRIAYRYFPFSGVTVNGLVVLGDDAAVADYYRANVLRGPGAFLEVAQGYHDYLRTMTRKLFRETNDIVLGQGDTPRRGPRG